MIKLKAFLFAAAMCLSIILIDNSTIQANPNPSNPLGQVVPKTKKISRKVYKKGRWVTVTTWHHGKKISKKVWRKGNSIGRKTGQKTKEIMMGPSKPTP